MSYATKTIKRDLNGDPIPQYFDVGTDDYLPLVDSDMAGLADLADDIKTAMGTNLADIKTKLDGTVDVQVTGSNAPLSGQKTVTTAGTAEALGGNQEYKELLLIAHAGNTGNIFVGATGVTSATGLVIPAGGFVSLPFVNTNEVFINASVSGEGVSFLGVI